MAKLIEVGAPTSVLYRCGRASGPLELPSETVLQKPARDRFDDPSRRRRTLYAAETPKGAFLEVLAYYRPDVSVLNDIDEKVEGDDPLPAGGRIPSSVMRDRRIASFRVHPEPAQRFLDLRELATRQYLRRAMAAKLVELKLTDLDASDVLGRNRELTQAIAGWAIDQGYHGIVYFSRYDPRLTNWALFEPLQIRPATNEAISPSNPDFVAAAEQLDLRLFS